MEKIAIYTEYITLQAALKLNNVIHSGGEIKHFLMTEKVWVNDVLELREPQKIADAGLLADMPGEVTELIDPQMTGESSAIWISSKVWGSQHQRHMRIFWYAVKR